MSTSMLSRPIITPEHRYASNKLFLAFGWAGSLAAALDPLPLAELEVCVIHRACTAQSV